MFWGSFVRDKLIYLRNWLLMEVILILVMDYF